MKTQFPKRVLICIVCLATLSAFFGCGKSDESAEQKAEQEAIERHEHDVQQEKVQWLEYQTLRKVPWQKWPAGPSTMEAIQFLAQLHHSGRLPGTEGAEHSLQCNMDPFATNYPISRTFNLKMENGQFVTHYLVVKASVDGSWQLERAWRTDAHGQMVKLYSIDNANGP